MALYIGGTKVYQIPEAVLAHSRGRLRNSETIPDLQQGLNSGLYRKASDESIISIEQTIRDGATGRYVIADSASATQTVITLLNNNGNRISTLKISPNKFDDLFNEGNADVSAYFSYGSPVNRNHDMKKEDRLTNPADKHDKPDRMGNYPGSPYYNNWNMMPEDCKGYSHIRQGIYDRRLRTLCGIYAVDRVTPGVVLEYDQTTGAPCIVPCDDVDANAVTIEAEGGIGPCIQVVYDRGGQSFESVGIPDDLIQQIIQVLGKPRSKYDLSIWRIYDEDVRDSNGAPYLLAGSDFEDDYPYIRIYTPEA